MPERRLPVTAELEFPADRKLYFASDFHLGIPNHGDSVDRERRLVRWLEMAANNNGVVFLVGDLFDFWFEYRKVVPKGHVRFLGKIAELTDRGIPVHIFTGNHDLWMFGYLQQELGVTVHHQPVLVKSGNQRILVGHGDGLGPGDRSYKLLKRVFTSGFAQFLFSWLHPDIGIGLALRWSRSSRLANQKQEEEFKGEEREFLLAWCKETEAIQHHNYYVFGHRHLPLDLRVGESARYINLGEWVHFTTYAVYDGREMQLLHFEKGD